MARFRRQKSRRNLKGGSDKPKILLRGYRRQLAFFIPWTLENKVFRVHGIKKSLPAYAEKDFTLVGMARFELATPRPPDEYSNRAELHPERFYVQQKYKLNMNNPKNNPENNLFYFLLKKFYLTIKNLN